MVSIEDSDIDANIDANIIGTDRDSLREIMHKAPRDSRANIIYRTKSGRVIANHAWLLRGMASALYVATNPAPAIVLAARGKAHTREPYGIPPSTGTTGPYARPVIGQGYSDIETFPSLICNAEQGRGQVTQGPNGDTGFLYFGMFNNSDNFEFGLQHSVLYDTYTPYVKDSATGIYQTYNNLRFQCGQNLFNGNDFRMSWFVLAQDTVGVSMSGKLASNGANYSFAFYYNIPSWSYACSDCWLTTTTSIAQTPTNAGYWLDGWYFGINPVDSYPNADANISWRHTDVGSCSAGPNGGTGCWLGANPPTYSFETFPADAAHVHIANRGSDNWTNSYSVGIDMRTPDVGPVYSGGSDPADIPPPPPDATPAPDQSPPPDPNATPCRGKQVLLGDC